MCARVLGEAIAPGWACGGQRPILLHHSFTLLWGVGLPLNPGHTVTARQIVLGAPRMCPPLPTLPRTGVSDTMQLSCGTQGQDLFFLLLQQALSPPNRLPSPVRHYTFKTLPKQG